VAKAWNSLAEGTTFIAPCTTWQGSGAETRSSEEKPTTNFLQLNQRLCWFLGTKKKLYIVLKLNKLEKSNYIRLQTEWKQNEI
jgi:hypothetical protein